MKKLLISAAFLFVMGTLHAQLGINAGLNLASWKEAGYGASKMQAGLHFGISYPIAVSGNFLVQPDIMYSQEGGKTENNDVYEKWFFNYVFLNVLGRYNIKEGFYVATGPGYGYLLNAKSKYEENVNDWNDGFKKSNVIWSLVAGYDVIKNVGLYVRGNLGLLNIIHEYGDWGGNMKTRSIQAGVRYTLNIAGK